MAGSACQSEECPVDGLLDEVPVVVGPRFDQRQQLQEVFPQVLGAVVGEITLKGTTDLVFAGALFFGLPAGLSWAAARPWFGDRSRSTRLWVGAWLFVTFASSVIDPDGRDFELLGSPAVNVLMFTVPFFVFGWIADPIKGFLDTRLPRTVRPMSVRRGLAILGMGLIALLAVLLIVSAFATFLFPDEETSTSDRLLSLLALVVIIGSPLLRGRISKTVALGAAGICGAALTTHALVDILG